jgi:hypothetical protein
MQEINSVHDEWAKKDSENRKHLAKRDSKVIGTIVVIAAGVFAFFAGKGKFK